MSNTILIYELTNREIIYPVIVFNSSFLCHLVFCATLWWFKKKNLFGLINGCISDMQSV